MASFFEKLSPLYYVKNAVTNKNILTGESKHKAAPAIPISLTADQVQQQYGTGDYGFGDANNQIKPTTSGTYGSMAMPTAYQQQPFSYSPITVDTKKFRTEPEQQAEIARQAAMQERQAALQRNQQRANAILGGFDQQIAQSRAFSDTFGDAQRAQLARDRDQQLAAADQSAVQRGLGNTTIRDALSRGVYGNYNQSRTNMESDLAAQNMQRDQALQTARLGFLSSINDPAMQFSDVANYAAQPSAIRSANTATAAAQAQANKQMWFDLVGNVVKAAS